ncbi:MAG: hypothetical protein AUJ47_01460 [Candidatus Marinimicrobia bacterium CG1_02_48_14]|nr:MAG: hypothetical protein AUJ47_01460 [Candidatus Marinimicrobia bacterium CG1_02_48_14]
MRNPLHSILVLLSIVVAQFLFGKKAAFPLGLILGYTAYGVALIVILCDLALMFVVYQIFSASFAKLKWIQNLRYRFESGQAWLAGGRWTRKLIPLGWLGVVAITATPFAGGVWTGIALSRTLAMNAKQTYWAVGLGSVIGCAIFLFAALGVMHLVRLGPENSITV